MSTKLVIPYDPDKFASVAILDHWEDILRLSRDDKNDALACLEFQDREEGASMSAHLNRSQVVMLRTALDLWLEHLDGQTIDDDDDDVED